MKVFSIFVFVVILVAAACGPVNNPPSPEYPCGPRGLVCGNHMCCWQGDICGYDGPMSRCPAGYCCNEGQDTVLAKKPYPQMSPKAMP